MGSFYASPDMTDLVRSDYDLFLSMANVLGCTNLGSIGGYKNWLLRVFISNRDKGF
uniref:Uncharacterized protein n=1 Tax=Lepeophtheirus salmonis TaxID=72036 RepID=A0A0K2UTG0_LEPSM